MSIFLLVKSGFDNLAAELAQHHRCVREMLLQRDISLFCIHIAGYAFAFSSSNSSPSLSIVFEEGEQARRRRHFQG